MAKKKLVTKIKTKLKRDDLVQVITGKDKGKQGKIVHIDRATSRVTVEGVNIVKKTVKKTQENPKGGIISKEAPISLSNVMYFDQKAGKPVRLGYRLNDDGKKVRFSKATNEVI